MTWKIKLILHPPAHFLPSFIPFAAFHYVPISPLSIHSFSQRALVTERVILSLSKYRKAESKSPQHKYHATPTLARISIEEWLHRTNS